MLGINLKVIVAMVTELCTHSISGMACDACHAPDICMLHTSANFVKAKTHFFIHVLRKCQYCFFFKLCSIWTLLEHLNINSSHMHVQYLNVHTRVVPAPVALSVECPLQKT